MALTDEERALADALGTAAGPPALHLAEQISELLLSTSASGASHEPGGPPSSGDAGASDGAARRPERTPRQTGTAASDRGTPDQGLRSTVAFRRPDLEQSVSRHPSARRVASRNETPAGLTALNGPDGRS